MNLWQATSSGIIAVVCLFLFSSCASNVNPEVRGHRKAVEKQFAHLERSTPAPTVQAGAGAGLGYLLSKPSDPEKQARGQAALLGGGLAGGLAGNMVGNKQARRSKHRHMSQRALAQYNRQGRALTEALDQYNTSLERQLPIIRSTPKSVPAVVADSQKVRSAIDAASRNERQHLARLPKSSAYTGSRSASKNRLEKLDEEGRRLNRAILSLSDELEQLPPPGTQMAIQPASFGRSRSASQNDPNAAEEYIRIKPGY